MADNKKPAPKKELSPKDNYQKGKVLLDIRPYIVQDSFLIEVYQRAEEHFRKAGDYEDAEDQAAKCRRLTAEAQAAYKENTYQKAVKLLQNAKKADDYDKPMELFRELSGYKDSEACCQTALSRQEALIKKGLWLRRIVFGLAAAVVLVFALFFLSSVLISLKNGVNTIDPNDPAAQTASKEESGSSDAKADSASGTEESASGTDSNAADPDGLPTLADAKPGDEVSFGKYKWLTLEKDSDTARLLLLHAEKSPELRLRPYNDMLADVTWETCTLRKWLNEDFLESGFSEEERDRILEQEIHAVDNEKYNVSGGNDTRDKVFLLSPQDLTDHKDILSRIRMNCWLMSPGNRPDTAALMSARNTLLDYGYPVDGTDFYVCPVIVAALS